MSTFKRKHGMEFYEVVVPVADGASEAGMDGLFDDCPICQELKRAMAAGEIEEVEVDLGDEV